MPAIEPDGAGLGALSVDVGGLVIVGKTEPGAA
jgi:hypothetical protein